VRLAGWQGGVFVSVRLYRLGFRDSPVTLLLKLCDDCYVRRLEAGASLLHKNALPFAEKCVDCESRKGVIAR